MPKQTLPPEKDEELESESEENVVPEGEDFKHLKHLVENYDRDNPDFVITKNIRTEGEDQDEEEKCP